MPEATFGFTVRRDPYGLSNDERPWALSWTVSLPHQCDSWMIVDEGYPGATTRAEAVADLERFIAEATWALNTIKGLPADWTGEISREEGKRGNAHLEHPKMR